MSERQRTRAEGTEILCRHTAALLDYMAKHLPDDVEKRLREMREAETGAAACSVYDCMFENLAEAERLDRPICQDTGLIQFFVKAGAAFPYLNCVEEALIRGTALATERAPLRPNAVETFQERNTGNNLAVGSPWIEWEIVPDSDSLTLEIYMAGGGCSLPGKAVVLMPSAGYEGIAGVVLDTVCDRGINACPPLLVGVGIGTCADSAGILSKRALLRPVGSVNPCAEAAHMERVLKEALNRIGIGPNALTGRESVLDVHVEFAAHHPATLAVGVSLGCWATRRGVIRFTGDLEAEILSHRKAGETVK